MTRYGSVIELLPEKALEYRQLHAAVWPEVLAIIHAAGLRNYSIFERTLPNGQIFLFSYFEYHGSNYAQDMAKLAAAPATQRWWNVCKPCQQPLPGRADGEWWATMQEVFHVD